MNGRLISILILLFLTFGTQPQSQESIPVTATLNVFDLPSVNHATIAMKSGYFPVLNSVGNQLFAVYRGGGGHLGHGGYLILNQTQEDGTTWGQGIVAANTLDDDRNPAFCVTPTGRLLLAYHQQGSYTSEGTYDPSLKKARCMVTWSDDGGKTWEEPKPLGIPGLESCSPYGRIILGNDNTLLMNVYGPFTEKIPGVNNTQNNFRDYAYLVRSKDNGLTWEQPNLIAAGCNETAMLRLHDGHLLACARTEKGGRLNLTHSRDGAQTWTSPLRLTNNGQHPADLIFLSNGWILLVYGDRSVEDKMILGMVSKDNGRSWELNNRCVFSRPVRGDFGYPSAARLADGRIGIAYYWAGHAKNAYDFEHARGYITLFREDEFIQAYQKTFPG